MMNFKEFIESEIFPKIGIEEKKTISERTANIWLKELGWTYQRQHKDIYYDGHERDDVVKYRKIFLTQMEEFERLKYFQFLICTNHVASFYMTLY